MPTNTTKMIHPFFAPPGSIEAMGAAGQAEIAGSIRELPREGTEDRAPWESLGFRFGEPGSDELFIPISQSPPGWEVVPTNHSMHSEIRDSQGRIRGRLFYKAAFYDRKASCYLTRRYVTRQEFDPVRFIAVDTASGSVLWESPEVESDDWTAQDSCRDAAREWLADNYPDAKDPLAYWDE